MTTRAEQILSYDIDELNRRIYSQCKLLGMDESDVDMYAQANMMWMNWREGGAEWYMNGLIILRWIEEDEVFVEPKIHNNLTQTEVNDGTGI